MNAFNCPDLSDVVPDFLKAEHSTGTSTIAVEFDGGVVLGADSRTTTGYVVQPTCILGRQCDFCISCRTESLKDNALLFDILNYFAECNRHLSRMELGEPPQVETAASVFRELCYNYRDQLLAGIICAGWDRKKGGQVYVIPLGGMMLRQPVAMGGSGSTYVYGYVDAHFKKGMTKEECLEFVTNTLGLAMYRDGSSGGVIRLAVITKDGVERKVLTGDEIPKFYQD
ncbi:20S proteasome, regulatory subunit beta, putative [Ixodes scapularis]|uniref:proteasome endopeptidase complex n=1 Tax=Ixodes scapularis TaxID=6945 RepID=B7PPL7_IXOSC|nr:20S proteasome, regulatory subunit beta, putative [Ixodes scapularis]|eukprot:XP_002435709.1 20S proteasome, regulatory subunit beta, putative [Ixodes scapularis]